MDKNHLRVLKKVKLFEGISETNIEKALLCLGRKTAKYEKGEIIIAEGEPVKDLGIVLSGSVQILKDDFDGARAIIAQFYPSELFAEALACAQARKSPVTAAAAANCEILFIPFLRISNVCDNVCGFHTKITMNMMKILARKNMLLNNKIEHLSKRSMREKILSYLTEESRKQNLKEFNIPFNRNELADFLSLDRSAMSRELGKMKEDGLIDFDKNRFKLKV
ncbi:MAG: Crp/Fnr family transcriptional regulator [Endomicrobia bacterium]|nr:Crp/Fnr family transcriptional regulator [Endomicrobiia bacterium]